ncbi:MAG: twin-arginine translocation signal domain-containing protein, partial [Thermoplasmata archaeon]
MSNHSILRRDFLKMIGIGTAAVGFGMAHSEVIAKTKNGVVIESPDDYGGFPVEKINNKRYPYQLDPKIIKQMSEKSTVFSRNMWDPARRNRPEVKENLTHQNLVEGKGKIPNQTRLDYALMAASWHGAR